MNIALAATGGEPGQAVPAVRRRRLRAADGASAQQAVVTGVGHWRGEGLALVEAVAVACLGLTRSSAHGNAGSQHGIHRDKSGRPVVVVTGMGVVTSLGAGKEDNWDKLTAGKSGIRAITRFATEGLKTRIAGTVDFVPVEPLICAGARRQRLADMAAEEAMAQSGDRQHRAIFPGPLFLAVAPVEVEWPQRLRGRARRPAPTSQVTYDDLIRAAASGRFQALSRPLPVRLGRRRGSPTKFGTEGSPISLSTACASGASAIQLGFEAIRRGETDAALCVGTDGSVNVESLIRFSLLSALSMPNDPPRGRVEAVLQEPRRLRDGGRRRRAGAGKLRGRQGARREDPRRARGLRRARRLLPPHPLEPGRQADHRLHAQRASPTPA